jgi:hypothetical protein
MRTALVRVVVLLSALLPSAVAAQLLPSETPLDVWGPDGPVRAVARDGDTLYVGGAFNYVGPPTGAFAIVDAATGTVAETHGFQGQAVAVADVPGGGWVVADFGRVSRLDAAGRRIAAFDVPVAATFLALQGSTVFIGGSFTDVRGVVRGGLAAVDLATGALLPWDPGATLQVWGGLLHQGVLYVVDQELTAPPPPQQPEFVYRVVAFDAATAAARPFSSSPVTNVTALAASGSTVFVAGLASGGASAGARVSVSTGAASPWNVALRVSHVVATPTQVFAAGATSGVNPVVGVFAVDPVSGVSSASPVVSGMVWQLGLAADRLVVSRTVVRGVLPRSEVLAVAASAPSTPLWTLEANNTTDRISANGTSIALTGPFTSIGGITRSGVYALDLRTRRVTPFAPFVAASVPSNVSSLAVVGSLLLVGGNVFENSSALVAVDRASGAVLPWAPIPNGIVDALAIDGSQLVVGGSFQEVAGVPRRNLAAISLATGLATPWRPDPDVFVSTVTATGGYVLPGGPFTTIGGVARPAVAAFAGSALLPWAPAAVGHVWSIGLAGARVGIAGDLEDATGNTVQDFRVFDAAGQRVTYPVPAQFASVIAVQGLGGQWLLGGGPATNGRHPLGIFSALNGADLAWAPRIDAWSVGGQVTRLARFDDLIVAGGDFSHVSGRRANQLAVFPMAGPPRGLRASVSGSALTLTWAAPSGAPPDGYVGEAFSGATSLGAFPVTGRSLNVPVPPGRFEVRVRATRGGGTGSTSSRVAVVAPAPSTPPAAPEELAATVVGRVLRLSWALGGGNAESYVLEAGTSSGAANIATFDTGTLDTDFTAAIPPGTYYLRVKARNSFGASGPSNEVTFVVP